MRNILLFILFILFSVHTNAQNVIIKQDVGMDFKHDDYGPNKKYFKSTFTGFGFLFGSPDSIGSEINWYKSLYYETGRRSKKQLSPFYAIGREASLNVKSYSIKQHDQKTFGGFQKHKSERLLLINANICLYNRFNFKPKRGNSLGKYLDIAAYGEYTLMGRHIITDKIDPLSGYKNGKYWLRGLKYLNKLNYGVQARIGFSALTFVCSYRLSEIFKKTIQTDYVEIPRFTGGICVDVGLKKSKAY